MLDSRYDIETPEGIELQLSPVGPSARALAWLIDALIRLAVYIVAAIILAFLGGLGKGLMLILVFVMEWFYPVWFEVWKQGMTPGKKSLGIKVVHMDGTPVGFAASMLRNLLRFVDFLPVFYGIGVVAMLANSRFARLGDLAAGTVVVYQPGEQRTSQDFDCEPVNPAIVLSAEESQAVVQFAERASHISASRREELAGLAAPLLPSREGEADSAASATSRSPSSLLCGVARWLVGSR